MLDKDIVDGKLGNMGAFDVEFKGGYLVGKVEVKAPIAGVVDVSGVVEVRVGAEAVIEAIKKAIPGKVDDAILDVVKAALKLV